LQPVRRPVIRTFLVALYHAIDHTFANLIDLAFPEPERRTVYLAEPEPEPERDPYTDRLARRGVAVRVRATYYPIPTAADGSGDGYGPRPDNGVL